VYFYTFIWWPQQAIHPHDKWLTLTLYRSLTPISANRVDLWQVSVISPRIKETPSRVLTSQGDTLIVRAERLSLDLRLNMNSFLCKYKDNAMHQRSLTVSFFSLCSGWNIFLLASVCYPVLFLQNTSPHFWCIGESVFIQPWTGVIQLAAGMFLKLLRHALRYNWGKKLGIPKYEHMSCFMMSPSDILISKLHM
jgi:hypothetical protein